MTTNAFFEWWQHLPLQISPYIIDFKGFQIRYYGVMYVIAFLVIYNLARWRLERENTFDITAQQLEGLMTAALLGLGGFFFDVGDVASSPFTQLAFELVGESAP